MGILSLKMKQKADKKNAFYKKNRMNTLLKDIEEESSMGFYFKEVNFELDEKEIQKLKEEGFKITRLKSKSKILHDIVYNFAIFRISWE